MTITSHHRRRDLAQGDVHDSGLASPVVDGPPISVTEPDEGRQPLRSRPIAWRRRVFALGIHTVVFVAATITALSYVQQVEPDELGLLGLASVLSPGTYLGLAALLVGFSVAAVRHRSHFVLGGYVTAVTLVVHGLGTFAYEHLRFPWAWKHVGIVDFIQRTGGVDPAIESLNAYHNWPGFFGLNAMITDTAGLSSPLAYAAWAPVLLNILYLAALFVIFRTFTMDERMIWTGLLLFTLGNWVGQDYFAPQGIAFFFYLVVVALLLHWFPPDRRQPRHLQRDLEPTIAAGVLFVVLAALVVTHQLTPVMTIAAVAGLALFRRTKLWWPLAVTAGLMVMWLLSFARPFFEEYAPRILADLGQVGGRIDSGLIDYGKVDTSQQVVSIGARGITAIMLMLGVFGYFRGFRTSLRLRSAVILSVAPLLLIVANSYGNEILFRAFLFILPMVAILGAGLWFAREPVRGGEATMATLAGSLMLLAFLSILAQHGNDVYTVFTDDEVAAAAEMYEDAVPNSAVVQLSTSYPTKFSRYENVAELTVGSFSDSAKRRFLADPAEMSARWLSEEDYSAGYVLLTRSQAEDVTRHGFLPAGSPEAIEGALQSSDQFEVLFDSPDALLVRLKESE